MVAGGTGGVSFLCRGTPSDPLFDGPPPSKSIVSNLRMVSETSQRDVVLSEQSESKDLRVYRDRSGTFGAKIFRLRFAPLKMTRSFCAYLVPVDDLASKREARCRSMVVPVRADGRVLRSDRGWGRGTSKPDLIRGGRSPQLTAMSAPFCGKRSNIIVPPFSDGIITHEPPGSNKKFVNRGFDEGRLGASLR